MNYKEINDKWKMFLAENAFKEDIVIKPQKKKRKKDKKEIIVSEKDGCMKEGSKCMDEWEEFNEQEDPQSGSQTGDAHSFDVNDEQDQEEESLEEMSAMSGGAVQGYAGNAFAPKKKIKPY